MERPRLPSERVAPRGPDGVAAATVECRAARAVASAKVWTSGPLPYGPHTVVLRSLRGPLVIDALEAVVNASQEKTP